MYKLIYDWVGFVGSFCVWVWRGCVCVCGCDAVASWLQAGLCGSAGAGESKKKTAAFRASTALLRPFQTCAADPAERVGKVKKKTAAFRASTALLRPFQTCAASKPPFLPKKSKKTKPRCFAPASRSGHPENPALGRRQAKTVLGFFHTFLRATVTAA